jgi:hypothetical protein
VIQKFARRMLLIIHLRVGEEISDSVNDV